MNSYPHFSPDGSRIVFASDRATGCMEVWVSKPDGTEAAQVPGDRRLDQGSPRWSPDGRWIAFDSAGADGHVDVYVVDSGGGQPRLLTPPSTDEGVPAWSRDGKWVYFRSNRTGRNEIWKAPFEGGEARQVTFQGGYTARESWDGATLYYVKESGSGPLFAAPVGGGAERRVADLVIGRGLAPIADGVYYLGRGDTAQGPVLKKYDSKTGSTHTVRQIEGRAAFGLAVSPDGKESLVSIFKPSTADLMLIENFR
jgi:Tol biopolymer transport system component